MPEFLYTSHAKDMLEERQIPEAWIERALANPDRRQLHDDGTVHCIKRIAEYGDRHLRVVIDADEWPTRVITFFFDRRLKGTP